MTDRAKHGQQLTAKTADKIANKFYTTLTDVKAGAQSMFASVQPATLVA